MSYPLKIFSRYIQLRYKFNHSSMFLFIRFSFLSHSYTSIFILCTNFVPSMVYIVTIWSSRIKRVSSIPVTLNISTYSTIGVRVKFNSLHFYSMFFNYYSISASPEAITDISSIYSLFYTAPNFSISLKEKFERTSSKLKSLKICL